MARHITSISYPLEKWAVIEDWLDKAIKKRKDVRNHSELITEILFDWADQQARLNPVDAKLSDFEALQLDISRAGKAAGLSSDETTFYEQLRSSYVWREASDGEILAYVKRRTRREEDLNKVEVRN